MSIKQALDSLNLGSIRMFLMSLYHREGAGRKPYPPVSMLKAQLLKHLRRVPSDRRLALLLKRNRRMARACGFKRKTPSHGLFTQFRHRLGKDGYEKVFSMLLKQLLKDGVVEGEVVALDSTAVKAYSQRSLDNKTGKSDHDARVGRGRRGFILGYKVHTACCTSSELPLAFTVQPCNVNEKLCFKPLLEKLKGQGVCVKTVVADAQYDSAKVRETVREFGAEPVIPYRKSSKVRNALKVGKDFVVHGVRRLVNIFRKRVSIERVFSRAKEWLLLDHLRVRGLEQAFIHACLSFSAMLTIALTAVKQRQPRLIRSIKHYTTQ
ncbi:transposase [Candidatus Bathyarchaeota archaeon]|nr:transposase [Candidatus Bathyarchaeota archaeon]